MYCVESVFKDDPVDADNAISELVDGGPPVRLHYYHYILKKNYVLIIVLGVGYTSVECRSNCSSFDVRYDSSQTWRCV